MADLMNARPLTGAHPSISVQNLSPFLKIGDESTVEYVGGANHSMDFGTASATSALTPDADVSYFELNILQGGRLVPFGTLLYAQQSFVERSSLQECFSRTRAAALQFGGALGRTAWFSWI
jgi:hypothetical protein